MNKFTAREPHDDSEALDVHYSGLERLPDHAERPHACVGGYVFLGHLVEEDPETGEEVEVIESVPCRRCADDGRGRPQEEGT